MREIRTPGSARGRRATGAPTSIDGNIIEYKVKAAGGEDLVATLAYAPPAYQNIATAN